VELESPSYVSCLLLQNVRQGKSRAGQWGFYLTFEQFGFVIGAFVGGLVYAGNHASVLIITSILFVVLAALSWFSVGRVANAPVEG
jgi:predicted MFS family arabinose efflux permease